MGDCLAAVVTAFNEPLQLQRVPVPELEPSAVLVRVDAATLCGTDVHIWHGMETASAVHLPYIPGHETAGTVVDVRGNRRDIFGEPLKPGDRIIANYPYCGHCYYCTVARQPNLCRQGVRYGRERADQYPYLLGGCAEYHYYPPGCDIIRIPDEVSSPLAASAACALRTIMQGFDRLGALAPHETVLIQGCGPLGLYALAVARDRGATGVFVIGAPETRLAVAREWGADATLNLDEVPDPGARIEWAREQTAGRGPDVVVQVAMGTAIPEGLQMLRPGGRYLSIGAGGGMVTVPVPALTTKHIQLIGVLMAEGRHFHQALTFLATRRREFNFDRIISGTYPLERTTEALQAMAAYREVKPVVLPNDGRERR